MEKQPTKKSLKTLEQQRLLNEIKEIEEIIRINIESSSLKEELLFCVAKIKQTAFSYKEVLRLGDLVSCARFSEPNDAKFKALYRREFDKIITTIKGENNNAEKDTYNNQAE